jgi:hypothetical protein
MRLPFGCWGWISTVPVLTTETDLMGPVAVEPGRELGAMSAARSVMVFSCLGRSLVSRRAQTMGPDAGAVPPETRPLPFTM